MGVQPGFEQGGITGKVFHIAGVAAGAEKLPAGIGYVIVHGFGDVRRAEIIAAADDQRGFFDGAEPVRDVIIF